MKNASDILFERAGGGAELRAEIDLERRNLEKSTKRGRPTKPQSPLESAFEAGWMAACALHLDGGKVGRFEAWEAWRKEFEDVSVAGKPGHLSG